MSRPLVASFCDRLHAHPFFHRHSRKAVIAIPYGWLLIFFLLPFFIILKISVSEMQATIDKVGRLHLPKLFIHSPDDEIVPYAQGRKLFETACEPKEFLIIRGDHNGGFLMSGDSYLHGIEKFLEKYF